MKTNKPIIPFIVLGVVALIVGLISFFHFRGKVFHIPETEGIKTEMKNLGFIPSDDYQKLFRLVGINDVDYIVAVVDEKDEHKNAKMDINFIYVKYANQLEAVNAFSNYYTNAQYFEKFSDTSGVIKYYYNKKQGRGYILYDMELKSSDAWVDNALMRYSSGKLLSNDDLDYLFGGMYIEGNKIVSITTTNRDKRYYIGEAMDNMKLPRPAK